MISVSGRTSISTSKYLATLAKAIDKLQRDRGKSLKLVGECIYTQKVFFMNDGELTKKVVVVL